MCLLPIRNPSSGPCLNHGKSFARISSVKIPKHSEAACGGGMRRSRIAWEMLPPLVTGLAYQFDGLVLLTNDGLFAETLASAEANILSAFDCKIQGDPPVDLLHKWRTGARAAGVNYGRELRLQ
eukprot:symbB.v1.2.007804.t1/scaffold485.1/size197678/7